jgi:uncharacterized protein YdeI (YjbR/CyaY-like superfamily)
MEKSANFLAVSSPQEWRQWLEKNHRTETEIWLVFLKKNTGKPCISYDYAVEEALCWGWIDSIIKRIDENSYVRKFTPRTDTLKWSALNLTRIHKLIQEGKVTPAGMAKIDTGLLAGTLKPVVKPSEMVKTIPPELQAVLSEDTIVWQNFNNRSKSEQRNILGWIGSAKKEETRQRRIKEVMELLAQNKKLGLK